MQEVYTSKMKKDVKLIKKQGKNKNQLLTIIEKLKNNIALDVKHKDHSLSGKYNGCRECHIEPDWLLIYKVQGSILYLIRTGSHSELFENLSDISINQLTQKLNELMKEE